MLKICEKNTLKLCKTSKNKLTRFNYGVIVRITENHSQ